jgi:hypothetical protein
MSEFRFHPGSPNELILFLDSVISSSLCAHTKDWICFLYANLHDELCQGLQFSIHPNAENNSFTVQYRGSEAQVPLRIRELVSHVEDAPGLGYQVLILPQAQSIKRVFSSEWNLMAQNLFWNIPLPIRMENADTGSQKVWERFNPAVWFALQGQYTIENFLACRPFWQFIEDHWKRLSSHFGTARSGNWEHHDAPDCCRCPGYDLPSLLAGAQPKGAADAVIKEILGHVDWLIVEQLKPALEDHEEETRPASVGSLQSWDLPQGSTAAWDHVALVPALEAVSNRLLVAFESLRNNDHFRSAAEQRLAARRAAEMGVCKTPYV